MAGADELTNTASSSPLQARKAHRFDPTAEVAIDLLCEIFPKAFVRHEARRRPLKIGIRDDILAALDGVVTVDELGRALRCYTVNKVYRSCLVAGATRIGLDGEPAGVVTPEHAVADQARAT